MSLAVMTLVWKNYNKGGSEKLAMLALSDWCNDSGGSLHPSISSIAKKICVSESQARRIIHGFIDDGYLDVIGNHEGGNPGQSRQYRLNIEKLSTPSMDATPSASATPSMDARRPLAPMRETPSTHDTLTTNIQPIEPPYLLSSSQAKPDPVHRLNGKKSMIAEVAAYLNLQAQRNFRIENPNGTPTAGALVIEQRLKEGYTVAQCKDVIGVKSNEWMGDEKMHQFLNPETLFRKKNFTKYLAQAEAEIGGAT